MAWEIDYTHQAQRQLAKLDKAAARRILDYMDGQVAPQANPRSLGNYWRYRVGDYRVICDIQDGVLHVLVIHIGHRGTVYRKL